MAVRPFRWLPHDHKRHAVREDAVAHEETTTLCGEDLTVPAARPGKAEWCWPTCTACDDEWRLREGIPLFPRQRPTSVRATSRRETRVAARA